MKFKLPEGWEEVKLGEVAIFKKGNAFKSKDYQESGTRIIRVSDLTNDGIDLKDCKYIDSNLAKEYKEFELFEGDIILTTVGSWPTNPNSVVGKVVRVNFESKNSLLNQNTVRIRSKENNQKFLYYRLKDEMFRNYIIGTAQGSANQASITQNDIKRFIFNLPPIKEQKAIADTLSSLDNKIELNNKINENLEQQAQAIFKHWFIDFEFPDENGNPYKSSGGQMLESELGMIPKGWEVKKVEEVVRIIRGASPRPIKDFIRKEGIPWVKIADATASNTRFITSTKEFIKEEGRKKSREVSIGTLILSNSATPGIPKILKIDACVHDGWLILNDYKVITKEYMYYFLKSERNKILSLSNGSVFRNLKTDILKNYKIIVPNKNIIFRAEELFNSVSKMINNNNNQNDELIEARDTLLPKLMIGELRIPLD